jgi:hypothetical protein
VTPKGAERLARLRERAEYLEIAIGEAAAAGRNLWSKRAELSALQWVIEEVETLDATVERMPVEIADWLTRCAPDPDSLDSVCEAARSLLAVDWRGHCSAVLRSADSDPEDLDL